MVWVRQVIPGGAAGFIISGNEDEEDDDSPAEPLTQSQMMSNVLQVLIGVLFVIYWLLF